VQWPPPWTALAACRAIQESLINATKYAAGQPAVARAGHGVLGGARRGPASSPSWACGAFGDL